jgi:hypothetical protein
MSKQKEKLIEQKQSLINQTNTCNSNNQPQEKRIRRRSFWFGFILGWIQNTYLCCLFLSYYLESSEMLKISKGIFLAMKKAFL